jgi:hypothetical protein
MLRKLLFLLLAILSFPSWISGQGIKTILIEGTPAIDGNGVFGRDLSGNTFDKVVINESGQAAFTGRMRETAGGFFDQQGLFLYEPETDEVLQIARMGQKAPGTVGNFLSFEGGTTLVKPFLALNDSGQIAMYATATGDVNFPNMTGAGPYLFSKEAIINIAMEDGADPRNLGTFNLFSSIGLANNGQMAFFGRVEIDSNNIPFGMFITDSADNSLKNILMKGDALPNSTDTWEAIDHRGINNNGYVVIMADDSDGDTGEQQMQDLWIASKDSLERLVNDGDLAPGGNGVFQQITFADINDSNEIVFTAKLAETSSGTIDDFGIFLSDEEGIHRIAQAGATPGTGADLSIFGTPRMNNNGQIALRARSGNFGGLFLLSKNAAKLLVNHGDSAPGSGTFNFTSSTQFSQLWINDPGQILFRAGLAGVFDGTNNGAYVVDSDGILNQVVRIGQALEGSTVEEFDIVGAGSLNDAGIGYGNQRPMNNEGQVVFLAELADGRDGIFIWTAPPPPPPDPEIDSISVDVNDVVVSLDTGIGATYQLRRRDTLNAGDWQSEGSPADGTGNNIELRHPNALPTDRQFYDVLITLPES